MRLIASLDLPRGTPIVIIVSGSFPGANVAAIAAVEALGLHPVIVADEAFHPAGQLQLAPVAAHLSAVGYWGPGLENARWVARQVAGISRICPLGEMQFPPLTWHQDGAPVLSSLVSWLDLEI